MKRYRQFACVGLVSSLFWNGGCMDSKPHQLEKPFERRELDACLTIVVDMSGSFATSWNDRAYRLFLELMDQFFTEGTGIEARVVIGQLSANEDSMLFDGRPEELRSRFRSADELNAYLQEHSNPAGSTVFQATERAVAYASAMQGVSENTRMMTVILSDLMDSETDVDARRKAGKVMLKTLTKYREMGGGIALYFVSPDEVGRWHEILKTAGFEPGTYVIESSLIARPQLPRLD
jgi:hypothetical protein